MDCKHASHLVSQAQDAKLTLGQRFSLRFHLMLCDACNRFSRQLALLREAMRQASLNIERDEHIRLSPDAHQRISLAIQSGRQSIVDAGRNPDQHSTN